MTEYVHVGSHADVLASGRHIGPGERVQGTELGEEDQHLLDTGRLLTVDSFTGGNSNEPITETGPSLKERAAQLGIEGRSKMNADELRQAIATHEEGSDGNS